ncbi:DedA family protein [Candidatus Falkowbacteria bacterium CG_4_10_14_0_2_um_filter_48_10]|uniref:DedA family protein n=1 Tax=Candidatus Falkowbacteria bacterium CG23_combo_of_CG06-09_8_20_14_all_49_15 TaxID=1974572 RepID=A0A2G9ZNS6_9BACT|nr:MAG: DedA family protein [Candidatus Falkowbacteria bacterium CG23_combo_of_CG06-09_8_20_14_all_49_15]PJA07563.1 MAG: DedA family protein [Candidatus Falkowbacteria bacterium CG_4_10_14_0_2_um_filter_48_10]
MEIIVEFFLTLASKLDYLGVFLLMAVESSFIPFPSEVVIPPAAYLAAQGKMNIFLVVGAGILGSLLGALINYYLAASLGRALILRLAAGRFGRIFFIDDEKIKKAENFFLRYGKTSTFFGRFIPAVRQLISLPAGFARMNLFLFASLTALGSACWVLVLAVLGYYFGANEEVWRKYYQEISYLIILFSALTVFLLIFRYWKKKSASNKNNKENKINS